MFWTFYIISTLISLEIFYHYEINLLKEEVKNEIKFKEKLLENYDIDDIIKNRFSSNFHIIVFLFIVGLIPIVNVLFGFVLIFHETKYFKNHYSLKIYKFVLNITYNIFKGVIKKDCK